MSESTRIDDREDRAERIDAARAEFHRHLPGRSRELEGLVRIVRADPVAKRARFELQRRIHALASGARLLRYEAMAIALGDAEAMLDRAAHAERLESSELDVLAATVARLPALAEDQPFDAGRPTQIPEPPPVLGSNRCLPATIAVVGAHELARMLVAGATRADRDAPEWDVESIEPAQATVEWVRTVSPDAIVLDLDDPEGERLARALAADALDERPPVVGVTSRATAWKGEGAVAGMVVLLAKPVQVETLVRECAALVKTAEPGGLLGPIGEPTIEELADRLADEVRAGVVLAASPAARHERVSLGGGAEVLSAVWGAVARVREVVTESTAGAVTFDAAAVQGAVALAPTWTRHAERGERRGAAPAGTDERLDGEHVLVVDDSPEVRRYLGEVLARRGARVSEAVDGESALASAIADPPGAIVASALLPGLDGFALARALRRDVALRDVPVLLLPQKDSLAARLRERGPLEELDADARELGVRVAQAMRPRRRVRARLAAPGEVRGRLDGISAHTLLALVASTRPDARITIADTAYVYDLQVREGAARSATRTTSEGSFQRGPVVLAALLGVRAGRFAVEATSAHVRPDIPGDARATLGEAVARARAAVKLLAGTRLLDVETIELRREALEGYLLATPGAARTLLERLAAGASLRDMILSADVRVADVEALVADVACHGGVARVLGRGGDELLGPETATQLAATTPPPAAVESAADRPDARSPSIPPPPPSPSSPSSEADEPVEAREVGAPHAEAPRADEPVARVFSSHPEGAEASPSPPPGALLAWLGDAPPPPSAAPPPPESVRAPEHEPQPEPTGDDAVSLATLAELDARDTIPAPEPALSQPVEGELAAPVSERRPRVAELGWLAVGALGALALVVAMRFARPDTTPIAPEPAQPSATARVTSSPRPAAEPRATATASVAASSAPAAPVASASSAPAQAASNAPPPAGEEVDLPPGAVLADGQGMIEVQAGPRDAIHLDHAEIGRGPLLRLAVAPGTHEVSATNRGDERVRFVVVRAGRRTRLSLVAPWKR